MLYVCHIHECHVRYSIIFYICVMYVIYEKLLKNSWKWHLSRVSHIREKNELCINQVQIIYVMYEVNTWQHVLSLHVPYVFSSQIYEIYIIFIYDFIYVFYMFACIYFTRNICFFNMFFMWRTMCVIYGTYRKEHVAMYLPHTLHICFVLG